MEVLIRRYLCLHCGTVVRVGPRGLAPRRRYGLGAIALALLLFALGDAHLTAGARQVAAREAVSPDGIVAFESELRWRSIERWSGAVKIQALFADVLAPFGLDQMRREAVLERLGQALVVHAGPDLGQELEAWTAFQAAHTEGWKV